jgi:hypothetical protein
MASLGQDVAFVPSRVYFRYLHLISMANSNVSNSNFKL